METRNELVDYADRLLIRARRYASPNHALITFPGDPGGFGRRVDGLEGFARTFLLAGFRIVGERGCDPNGYAHWYARGIAAGVDPQSPERWVKPTEHDQAKVEAASIALILDMTRPWIWDQLDPVVQGRVIDYLAPIVGDKTYPKNNWLWFRVVVQTFLKSVGGPYSLSDIQEDLQAHESYVRSGGWYSDGAGRAYDHYIGWAMHLYPALWSRMQGADQILDPRDMVRYFRMLERYLEDVVHLVGGNGSPLMQGRSLIYRYAAAAQFWVGAYCGVATIPMGQLRECAMSMVTHFATRADDALTMGWHHEWREMAQSYSGPSSPYWAVKGLLGLALPADHPVWTAPSADIPVKSADSLFTIQAPGWVVSSTQVDGIVRVINHGTDCGYEKQSSADSPLYARFGYSTHTAPMLGDDSWQNPLDQSVVLLDQDGHATHRSGMSLLELREEDGVGIAVSSGPWQWIEGEQTQIGHGQGLKGGTTMAGVGTVISVIRGADEIRLVRVADLALRARRLRIGGWALSGTKETEATCATDVEITCGGLLSQVSLLDSTADCDAGIAVVENGSMLADFSYIPWVEDKVSEGSWVAAHIRLAGAEHANTAPVMVEMLEVPDGLQIQITWSDSTSTQHKVELGQ